MARIKARIDKALAAEANTEARNRVLGIYHGLAVSYHAARDALLFQTLPSIERMIARWKCEPKGR